VELCKFCVENSILTKATGDHWMIPFSIVEPKAVAEYITESWLYTATSVNSLMMP